MAKPTTTYDWATDATHPAGGDAWSGLANKVAPSAGRQATGWEPEDRPPAEHLNELFNTTFEWINYLDSRVDANDEIVYTTTKTRTVEIPATRGIGADWDIFSSLWIMEAQVGNNEFIQYDVSAFVPTGADLTTVEVLVKPAAARSTSARMELSVLAFEPDWATPANTGTGTQTTEVEDDGTTDWQELSVSPTDSIFDSIDRSVAAYTVLVRAGSSTSGDLIKAVRVTFEDPGPRNF